MIKRPFKCRRPIRSGRVARERRAVRIGEPCFVLHAQRNDKTVLHLRPDARSPSCAQAAGIEQKNCRARQAHSSFLAPCGYAPTDVCARCCRLIVGTRDTRTSLRKSSSVSCSETRVHAFFILSANLVLNLATFGATTTRQ